MKRTGEGMAISGRLGAAMLVLAAMAILPAGPAAAQAFPGTTYQIYFDGTAANPAATLLSSLNPVPTVTRSGPGSYVLQFPRTIRWAVGTSHTRGPGGDTGETMLTLRADSGNLRRWYVTVRGLNTAAGTIGAPLNAYVSLEVKP